MSNVVDLVSQRHEPHELDEAGVVGGQLSSMPPTMLRNSSLPAGVKSCSKCVWHGSTLPDGVLSVEGLGS